MKSIIAILTCMLVAIASVGAGGEPEASTGDVVTAKQLGGENRQASYLALDRDLYKPGDRLYLRGLVLDALTNQPKTDSLEVKVTVTAPRGEIIAEEFLYSDSGILSYAWLIPKTAVGGDYKLKLSFPDYAGGYPPVERSFRVMAYRAPRIVGELTFFKDGYLPGDSVRVSGSFWRAEGAIPAGAMVKVTANVDGLELTSINTSIDADGRCEAEFKLPSSLDYGDGLVAFQIWDGAVQETISKTIPILLDNFSVDFYPEGGELIADLPNRIYFQALFANGKPADIEGQVKTTDGRVLAEAATVHEGRGVFRLTPPAGEQLVLELPGRQGTVKSFSLPEARPGFSLMADELAYQAGAALTVSVFGNQPKTLTLTVSRREKQLAKKNVTVSPGTAAKLAILLPASAEGVLRLTLFDGKRPLAERLIYRAQDKPIAVSVSLARADYSPGDQVELTVKTTDHAGNPVAATVGLCVSDYSIQRLVDQRERAPDLAAMVFLEPEVEELFAAEAYLTGSDEANRNLDLLLGVQGWRRFAFYNWNDFYERYGDAAKRLAVLNIVPPPKPAMVNGVFNLFKRWDDYQMPMARMAPLPEAAEFDIEAPMAAPVMAAEAAAIAVEFLDEGLQKVLVPEAFNALIIDDDRYSDEGFVVIREYANKQVPKRQVGQRIDFRETIYWNAQVTTSSRDGSATLKFNLNDSITTFQVRADAISAHGKIAVATAEFDSVKAFYVEAKMPLTLSKTDRLRLPFNLINNSSETLEGELAFYLDGALLEKRSAELFSGSRSRINFELAGFEITGPKTITVKADFGVLSDSVTREFMVAPVGFPIVHQTGGRLMPNSRHDFSINLPENYQDLRTKILIYPSPAANLSQALEALIRQPYGCFEQTSSTSYPLVMAQQYFLRTPGVEPEIIQEAQKNLDDSLRRLTSFESPQKGFEWFGDDPGHEALTAYGLMQFMEMAKVMDVNPSLLDRTKQWLLNRRDGQGGYLRNQQALDSFGGAPETTTNAYITWALVNAGISGLDQEIAWLEQAAFSGDDSYVQALAAYVLFKVGETAKAEKLMGHLALNQQADGAVSGAIATITRSRGNSLIMETTALACLAWLYSEAYSGNVEAAMRYITANCQSGSFFSTQGTVLALKAIILYDEKWSRPKHAGAIEVWVNGDQAVVSDFSSEDRGIIELPDLSPLLKPGSNALSLVMKDGSAMPFTSEYQYYAQLPLNSADCRLDLQTTLSKTALNEGATAVLTATITNRTDSAIPMPIAIIGIPGGLEVRYDKLKELKAAGIIDSFELLGQEVVLYKRQLESQAKLTVNIDVTAVLPGTFTAPASRVYEYYDAEHKIWAVGSQVTVQ